MTIDLKAIRAAAEAAIKKYGGYPVTDPAFVIALLDRLEAAETEVFEQARLLGIGGEKELGLMAKLDAIASQLAIYEKHGVTCQTFGHKLTGCAECNRDDFAAMKEQK